MSVVDEVLQAFQRHDDDGDGILTREQFASLMRELDAERWISQCAIDSNTGINGDADGRICYNDFATWITQLDPLTQHRLRPRCFDRIVDAWSALDFDMLEASLASFASNSDGTLDFDEMVAILVRVQPCMSRDEVMAWVKALRKTSPEGHYRDIVRAVRTQRPQLQGFADLLVPSLPESFGLPPASTAAVQLNGDHGVLASIGSVAPGRTPPPELQHAGYHDLVRNNSTATGLDVLLAPFLHTNGDRDARRSEGLGSFQRCTLPFPPQSRSGFTVTPLDDNCRRLLVFGGLADRSSRCLADVVVLDFSAVGEIGSDSSCSDLEEIVFRENYRSEVAPCSSTAQPCKPRPKRKGKQAMKPSEPRVIPNAGTPGGSEDEDNGTPRSGRQIPAMTTQSVFASMREREVQLHRVEAEPSYRQRSEKSAARAAAAAAKAARWRIPKQHGVARPRPRSGHVASLQAPMDDTDDAHVLIHGGFDDGGAALGDTLQLRVFETMDDTLEAVWAPAHGKFCQDDSGASIVEPRPRAFHSAVVWPAGGSQDVFVIFGGVGLAETGSLLLLGDLWLFRTLGRGAEQDTDTAHQPHWEEPRCAASLPPSRWGHSASLVGGTHGCGFVMLLCGGSDASGTAFADCWTLDLEDMRWDRLQSSSVPSGIPMLGGEPPTLGPNVATWVGTWDVVLVWGGRACGVWSESEWMREKRLRRLRQQEAEARRRAREQDAWLRKQQGIALQLAKAEKKAAEKERGDAEKLKKKAELEAWAHEKRLQRERQEAEERAQRARELEAEEKLKALRVGGGFNLQAAAVMNASTGTSSIPPLAAPWRAENKLLERSGSSSALLAAGTSAAYFAGPTAKVGRSGQPLSPVRPDFTGWQKRDINLLPRSNSSAALFGTAQGVTAPPQVTGAAAKPKAKPRARSNDRRPAAGL